MKPARWSLVRPPVPEVATAAAEGVAAVVMVVAAEAVAAATAVAVRAAAVAAMVAVVKAAATAGGGGQGGSPAPTALATPLAGGRGAQRRRFPQPLRLWQPQWRRRWSRRRWLRWRQQQRLLIPDPLAGISWHDSGCWFPGARACPLGGFSHGPP